MKKASRSLGIGGSVEGEVSLHYEKVQWFRLRHPEYRENRMSLSAMMRFMIEQMGENFSSSLPSRSSIQSSVVPWFLEGGFVKGLDECNYPAVFFSSGSVQRPKVAKQYRVQFFGVIPRSSETSHPDAIRDQKMIESAVKTPEIGADFFAVQHLVQRLSCSK
jgi:hypothetical protein